MAVVWWAIGGVILLGAIGIARSFVQVMRDRESTKVDKVFRPFIAASVVIVFLFGVFVWFWILHFFQPPPTDY